MSKAIPLSHVWVSCLIRLYPELAGPLDRTGIKDTATYLELEARLPRRVRAEVARFRHDLTLIAMCEVRDQARAAPPWIRHLPLSEIRVPERICAAVELSGIIRVQDIEAFGDQDLLGMPALGIAGLHTLSLAILLACRSGPPRPVLEQALKNRVQTLVCAAPTSVRALEIRRLLGLRARPLRSLEAAGALLVSDLESRSDRELTILPGFGQGSLNDLIRAIERVVASAAEGHQQDQFECLV